MVDRKNQMTPSPSRIIFHIGYPKCASSFLQTSLFTQSRGTFLRDYRFSHLTKDPNISLKQLRSIMLSDGRIQSGKPLIFSREGFVNSGSTGLQKLIAAFPDATYMLVIREQFSVIRSLYCHYVCNAQTITGSFENFLIANEQLLLKQISFQETIAKIIDLVGAAQTKIHLFEELYQDPAEFVRKISKTCDDERLNHVRVPLVKTRPSQQDSRLLLVNRTLNYLSSPLLSGLEKLCEYRAGPIRYNTDSPEAKIRRQIRRHRVKLNNLIGSKLHGNELRFPLWFIEKHKSNFSNNNTLVEKLTGLDLKIHGYS